MEINAQEILDQAPTTGGIWTKDRFMATFYPEEFKQEQADRNLTKCLRSLI